MNTKLLDAVVAVAWGTAAGLSWESYWLTWRGGGQLLGVVALFVAGAFATRWARREA